MRQRHWGIIILWKWGGFQYLDVVGTVMFILGVGLFILPVSAVEVGILQFPSPLLAGLVVYGGMAGGFALMILGSSNGHAAEVVKCPKCHRWNYPDAKTCRRCGTIFVTPAPPILLIPRPGHPVCHNCGFEIKPKQKICPFCGVVQ